MGLEAPSPYDELIGGIQPNSDFAPPRAVYEAHHPLTTAPVAAGQLCYLQHYLTDVWTGLHQRVRPRGLKLHHLVG